MMKITALFVILALVGVSAFSVSEDVLRGEFAHFALKFGRVYESAIEAEKRFLFFRANYIRAMQLNEKNGAVAHGVTRFMDWSPEEQKNFLGYVPDLKARRETKYNVMSPVRSSLGVPAPFDWRGTAVTETRDQGQCGSCWAFSAIAQVESAMLLKYKNGTSPSSWLSTQQTVSCSPYDWGCRGGDTITAYRYMLDAGGIASEKGYPYEAADTSCRYNKSMSVTRVTDWSWVLPPCDNGGGDCSKQDEGAMAEIMRSKGPASICVMVSNDWFSYTGPAPYQGTCTNNYYDLNHCVQVVGIGNDNGNTYWIVRNSWGTGWGHNGYIYLPYGKNACGVADEVTMVTVA